jgi:predicted nucleotidyltransferase
MIDEKTKDAIVGVLKRYPVKLAYVYGSYAKGIERPDSDIDIAVVPKENVSIDEFKLAGDINRAVKGKQIEARLIGVSGRLLLTFNAVRLEQPIYSTVNEQSRVKFETGILMRQLDAERLSLIKRYYRDKYLRPYLKKQ